MAVPEELPLPSVTRLRCNVEPDHLEKIATAKRPVLAIAELIWNALDADATKVDVEVLRNKTDGIELIRVTDNGHGITPERAEAGFGHLGGSWKKTAKRTDGGRILHGKDGQGRFKAFGLGGSVMWRTRYKAGDEVREFSIAGTRTDLADVEVTEHVASKAKDTGTVVEVRQVTMHHRNLDDAEEVAKDLALRFALYLRACPGVSIQFDGVHVDMREAEDCCTERNLAPITLESGETFPAKLVVIEWKVDTERALFLCDPAGLVLDRVQPGIHEPGATFTAYLKSEAVAALEGQGALGLDELHADVRTLQAAAKVGIRAHFRERRAREARGLIEQWKAERVYPFEGEPRSILERTEREVFDVVAKNVNDYLPNFESSDARSKRFSLRLLKAVMESSPSVWTRIIREVLELPADRAQDLADLLQRTTLTAIINASKTIANRLDFLSGLELLLFDPTSKQQLLERAQLQKILEEQTWIFGEQFALTVADQSLNEVLAKHRERLGREPGADREDEVELPDGGRGIVDLMLSRCLIPQNDPESRHHLVIELKRPSQKITNKVLGQVEDYALAVAKDERFRDSRTTWEFWAVSNTIDDTARMRTTQSRRPKGLLTELDDPAIQVWAMPWSRILECARARLHFFQQRLELSASADSGLSYLHKVHERYLPPVFADPQNDDTK